MDHHRDLYKSIGSNASNSSRHQKSVAHERRQRHRHDLYAAQRCISEEPAEALPSTAPGPSRSPAPAAPPKLSKQQQYHLKFLAWRAEKQKQKSDAQLSNRRKQPFLVAVAKQKFIEVPMPPVPPMPRSQLFRPPANLPTLGSLLRPRAAAAQPLNNPIVTRSMARAQQQNLETPATGTAPHRAPVFKAPSSRAVTAATVRKPAPPSTSAAGRIRHKKMQLAVAAAAAAPTAKPNRNLLSVPEASVPIAVATSNQRLPSADGNSDGDTTAVGAPFSADGSMITSTAQKLHTKRGCTPDPQMSLDVFSPIELGGGGGGGGGATGSVAVAVATPLEAQAVRRSGHKRRSQRPEAASADACAMEQNKIDLNVTPTGIIKITDTAEAAPCSPAASAAGASDRRSLNYVSPYVSTARGKVSARKERAKRESVYRLDLNRSPESLPDPPEVRQRREAALYFRQQLDAETERLAAMADHWQRYKEQAEAAEEANALFGCYVDLIDVTVGQTRLLLAKKFQQFRGLIGQCETGTGEQPVLAHDLEGFWSMVYMQVENCNGRFEKLEQLRASGWTEEAVLSGCAAAGPRTAAVAGAAMKKPKVKAPRTGNPFLEQIKKASRQRLLEAKEAHKAAADAAAAAAAAPAASVQRKTPRKSMLASVLCMEAQKSLLSGPSPGRQSSLAPTSSVLSALNANATNGGATAATAKTRSILKTPATKRGAGRAVVFAVSDAADSSSSSNTSGSGSPLTPRRKARNALKFVCTPMQKPADYREEQVERDENAENDVTRLGTGRQSFYVTPKRPDRSGLGTSVVVPIQRAADRFSLLDSPVVNFQRMTLTDTTTGPRRFKQ